MITNPENVTASAGLRDDITASASPRPWRVEKAPDECRFWIVRNSDGVSLGMTWREADAALIVQAVNERDRLRDLTADIQKKEKEVWKSAKPTFGNYAVALMLDGIASRIEAAIGEGGAK